MQQALFRGKPVTVRYRPNLLDTAGQEAHAATFIRRRVIVLDTELKGDSAGHERILLHEFFHFVWVRLGNAKRLAWEGLLHRELAGGARGEAGWSAEWRKQRLSGDDIAGRSRKWREYCCESFCDTGSLVAGAQSEEVTLGRLRLERRRAWFRSEFRDSTFPM
jgi:hypothetical protein